MARRERLLDPETDRLHRFAHDLRQVRAAAGNPTYRVLAKRAGYSATSLSDAARGERIPTLEVVLAYVGACDGDRELWAQRWNALFVPETAPPAQPEKPRRSRTALLAVAAVVVLISTAIGITVVLQRPGRATCPSLSGQPLFTGETQGKGVLAYEGPSTAAPVTSSITENCVLGFTGYCVGEKQIDTDAQTLDLRWLILTDGSMVPSGKIHGGPPASIGPTRCRGDRPPPESLTLSVSADPLDREGTTATASGVHLDIVGFAEQWIDEKGRGIGPRPWRQTAIIDDAGGFRASWSTAAAPAAGVTRRVIIAAACLGGGAPTSAIQLAAMTPTGPVRPQDLPRLSPDEAAAGALTACGYPKDS
jgi:hypothetical protein